MPTTHSAVPAGQPLGRVRTPLGRARSVIPLPAAYLINEVKKMRMYRNRVLGSAALSALLNLVFVVVSIGTARNDEETFIQKCIRFLGLPAGILRKRQSKPSVPRSNLMMK
jgi:hypothetical protein